MLQTVSVGYLYENSGCSSTMLESIVILMKGSDAEKNDHWLCIWELDCFHGYAMFSANPINNAILVTSAR